jgi:hypothetical protein
VVLSQWRRNDGPKHTKILVTNLPESVTAREIVGVYLRRWWVERFACNARWRGRSPRHSSSVRPITWLGSGFSWAKSRDAMQLPVTFEYIKRPEFGGKVKSVSRWITLLRFLELL